MRNNVHFDTIDLIKIERNRSGRVHASENDIDHQSEQESCMRAVDVNFAAIRPPTRTLHIEDRPLEINA
jgi:hypothetical protein